MQMQGRQRNVQKNCDARAELLFCSLNLLLSFDVPDAVAVVMYRSNRSFNMPPRATPWEFDFFENFCSNSPLPGPKCRSNAPH